MLITLCPHQICRSQFLSYIQETEIIDFHTHVLYWWLHLFPTINVLIMPTANKHFCVWGRGNHFSHTDALVQFFCSWTHDHVDERNIFQDTNLHEGNISIFPQLSSQQCSGSKLEQRDTIRSNGAPIHPNPAAVANSTYLETSPNDDGASRFASQMYFSNTNSY